MRVSAFSRYAGLGVFFATAIVLAACTSTDGPLLATASPSPTPFPPFSATVTTSQSGAIAVPSIFTSSGIALAGTLPAVSPAPFDTEFSVTETISVSAPAGLAPLARRRGQTLPTPMAYVQFSTSTPFALSWSPGFTFTAGSITSGQSYYLAYYNGTNWVTPFEGPGTVIGDTVTFGSIPGSPPEYFPVTLTLPVFALYTAPCC